MEIAGVEIEALDFQRIGSWPPLFRKIVIGLACLVTFIMGYIFGLGDQIFYLSEATNKFDVLSKKFVTAQQQVANLEMFKKEVKIVGDELDTLTEQLPQSGSESGLLADISQQAVSSGLQFISIKPEPTENKGFYHESPFDLTLTGNYKGFGEFASNVSMMPRIITFHKFTIKKNDTKGNGSLMMEVLAKTYWSTAKEHNP